MKFKKIISALVSTVVLMSAVSASAMSLLQPYGYSMPIEKLAQNPSDSALTNESFIALPNHNVSLDGTDLVMTGNSSDGMSDIAFGGQGYNGNEYTVKPSNGKMINKMQFTLSASNVYINGSGYTNEPADIYTFVNYGGKDNEVGIKISYVWKPSERAYVQAIMRFGSYESATFELKQSEMYTLIWEFDIPNDAMTVKLIDSHNQIVKTETKNGLGMNYVRNGYRFRLSNILNAHIREMSTYRETFIIKNETFTNGDTITASISAASDCTERAAYGKLITTSPTIMLGQFDAENRMLGYDVKNIAIPGADKNATTPDFKTITASVAKKADYSRAYACIWTGEEEMIPYRDILAD